MAFESEPSEPSRKTLDDIRRELDAEYGYTDTAEPALDDGAHERAPGVAPAERPMMERSRGRDDAPEDRFDAPHMDFRHIADRYQVALERRSPVAGSAARRSGYVVAGLVGCVAGQVLLLAVLTVMRYGGPPEVSRTGATVSPGSEVTSAATPVERTADDPPRSSESDPRSDSSETVALSPSSTTAVAPAVPQERTAQPSSELPPRIAREPRPSSSPPPAIVSAATVRENPPPRVAGELRPASPRSSLAGSKERADSQARLRSALDEWRRTSAPSEARVAPPEPVIVLSPDGRTARIYVSMTSPIGLIPREQRWTLGPRGWNLVEDRQAGLPIAAPPATSRDR